MDRSNDLYSFILKSDKKNPDVIITRTIFAIDATIAFLQIGQYGFGMLFAGITLSFISYFLVFLSKKIPVQYLFLAAIVITCLLTWQPYFLLIIVLYWGLNRLVNKKKGVTVNEEGVVITNSFSVKKYDWKQIQFVVLKDGLLTIQFYNNRFFQNEVEWEPQSFDQNGFNRFCDSLTDSETL